MRQNQGLLAFFKEQLNDNPWNPRNPTLRAASVRLWMRGVIWLIAVALAIAVQGMSVMRELALALRHLGLVGIAMLSSYVYWIVGVSGLLIGLWAGLWWRERRQRKQGLVRAASTYEFGFWHVSIVNLNRWVGRAEALLPWITLGAVLEASLGFQVAVLGFVAWVAAPAMDAAVLQCMEGRTIWDRARLWPWFLGVPALLGAIPLHGAESGGLLGLWGADLAVAAMFAVWCLGSAWVGTAWETARPSSAGADGLAIAANVVWLRRPFYYVASLVGVVLLLSLGEVWTQSSQVGWLLGGTAATSLLRAILWEFWRRGEIGVEGLQFRKTFLQPVHVLGGRVTTGVVAAMGILVPSWALFGQGWTGAHEGPPMRTIRPRPVSWELRYPEIEHAGAALFLVADNQFHSLSGNHTGGQTGLVDDLVPVAIRPVEQDLLAPALLHHFGDLYENVREKYEAKSARRLRWAHLGDLADISCQCEMTLALKTLKEAFRITDERLAAVIPGNHDGFYTGNFVWSPEWASACGSACSSERLDREASLRSLRAELPADEGTAEFYWQHAQLGHVAGRDVVAVFLDTSDYDSHAWLGAAGVVGDVSDAQVDAILKARKQVFSKAWVVLLMHHPPDKLMPRLKESPYSRLRDELGRDLVAVVASHTHEAAERAPTPQEPYWQFTVGSTSDYPQQAAVLAIHGPGEADCPTSAARPCANLVTLPAVAGVGVGPSVPRVPDEPAPSDDPFATTAGEDATEANAMSDSMAYAEGNLTAYAEASARPASGPVGDTGTGPQPDCDIVLERLRQQAASTVKAGGPPLSACDEALDGVVVAACGSEPVDRPVGNCTCESPRSQDDPRDRLRREQQCRAQVLLECVNSVVSTGDAAPECPLAPQHLPRTYALLEKLREDPRGREYLVCLAHKASTELAR